MVLAVGGLDALGESPHTLGQGKEALEKSGLFGKLRQGSVLFSCRPRGQAHHDPDVQSRVADRVEIDVTAGLARLPQHGFARLVRDEVAMLDGAVRDDETLRAEQDQLRRFGGKPFVFQPQRDLVLPRLGEIRGEQPGALEQIAHARVEGGAAEVQRVVECLLDAHVEPGIDALAEKLERKGVDDDHRGYRKGDEECRDAPRETCSGLALPHLPGEAVEVVSDEHRKREQSRHVDDEEHRVEAVEACRALRRVAHEPERGEQQDQRRNGQESGIQSAHCVRIQEYQSLRSRHRERNQASGRNGDGRASMSSRARSRTR